MIFYLSVVHWVWLHIRDIIGNLLSVIFISLALSGYTFLVSNHSATLPQLPTTEGLDMPPPPPMEVPDETPPEMDGFSNYALY